MIKPKTIYIFEGESSVAICKGTELDKYYTDKGAMYRGNLKHRGLFSQFFPISNIPESYLGNPKKLIVKGRPLEGWTVVKVKMDYESRESFIPDVDVKITARLEFMRNEIEMWKRKFYDMQNSMMTMSNRDKFEEKMKKELKLANEAKNLLVGYQGYGGYDSSSFMNRWMQPPAQAPPPSE